MKPLAPDQKVFGLGLSRTGTTSLASALNILGIPTVHFPSDRTTYHELREGKYELTVLQQYQGAVDIPLAPYYAQLDMSYPGSKFILTTRDLHSWLQSVEEHWRRWRDRDPHKEMTEFVCACVYGVLAFNRDRFRFVFETHNRNIRRYFRSRERDFLTLDIFQGDGWDKLCNFLGLPVPGVPFPYLNRGHDNESWMHKLDLAAHDLAALLPPESNFILVDDAKLGQQLIAGRRAIPFLQRDRRYYGPPPDAATAIRELEALRRSGAEFIVFTWPSFWWLEYYSHLQHHLSQSYRRIENNDRIVAFDLRSTIFQDVPSKR